MNPLQSELRRLYRARSTEETARALVIELTGPPSWAVLSQVWQGVQAELDLPAPAIAVSGTDGLQLWFSVADPVPADQARAFLEGLRRRFLSDVKPERVRLQTEPAPVPAAQAGTDNWSAFLAPDLAPVFADTPWLDIPPSEEGQAALLRGLKSLQPAQFETALQRLAPAAQAASAAPAPMAESAEALDPRRFLEQVMNDTSAPLALRIEAAKALLPLPAGVAFPAR